MNEHGKYEYWGRRGPTECYQAIFFESICFIVFGPYESKACRSINLSTETSAGAKARARTTAKGTGDTAPTTHCCHGREASGDVTDAPANSDPLKLSSATRLSKSLPVSVHQP